MSALLSASLYKSCRIHTALCVHLMAMPSTIRLLNEFLVSGHKIRRTGSYTYDEILSTATMLSMLYTQHI